jgi:hypothetical protein
LHDNGHSPYSTKLLILNEVEILDDYAFRALDWFRTLRNRAAQEPFFHLLPADLAQAGGENLSRPENLHTLCLLLLGGLWNRGLDVFLPVFTSDGAGQPAMSSAAA